MPTLYRTMVIDPPWDEQGSGKSKRGADRHYDLLKTREIVRTILKSGVFRPDPSGCHLYLWVTNSFLEDGLKVMGSLDFKYKTHLVWAKDSYGLGQYFRQQTELCLFGVFGETLMTTNGEKTSNLIREAKRKHSQKPMLFYSLVERNSPEPRLEMFARTRRYGWDSWGDEIQGEPQQSGLESFAQTVNTKQGKENPA